MIFSNKNGMYQLYHESWKDVRVKILGSYQFPRKSQKWMKYPRTQYLAKNETFINTSKTY